MRGEKLERVRRLKDGRLKDDDDEGVGEPRYCGITGGINGQTGGFCWELNGWGRGERATLMERR